MKERPILFSGPMVQAILAGTKTQTRRAVALPRKREYFILSDRGSGWWPYESDDDESEICDDGCEHPYSAPYGLSGDQIWCKETFYAFGRWETRYSTKKAREEWHFVDMTLETGKQYQYQAGDGIPKPLAGERDGGVEPQWWKRPAIFMPRHASRIQLEVKGVRVEQLDSISNADCIAEGAPGGHGSIPSYHYNATPFEHYRHIWEQINGRGSWDENPFVWVIEFKTIATTVKPA